MFVSLFACCCSSFANSLKRAADVEDVSVSFNVEALHNGFAARRGDGCDSRRSSNKIGGDGCLSASLGGGWMTSISAKSKI